MKKNQVHMIAVAFVSVFFLGLLFLISGTDMRKSRSDNTKVSFQTSSVVDGSGTVEKQTNTGGNGTGTNTQQNNTQQNNLCGQQHEKEIYEEIGDGHSLQIDSVGLCVEGAVVDTFSYNMSQKRWKWVCNKGGSMSHCLAKETACGDGKRQMEQGEMCDNGNNNDTYCSAGEICTSSCLCKVSSEEALPEQQDSGITGKNIGGVYQQQDLFDTAISASPACGGQDGESIYNALGDGVAVSSSTAGLCENSEPVDFLYNESGHEWTRSCGDAVCLAKEDWCGNGTVDEGEECDGVDPDVCDTGSKCSNLCICIPDPVDGVCGEKSRKPVYDTSETGEKLSSNNPLLCKSGKIEEFVYDKEGHLWSWKCLGAGGGEDALCHTLQERCSDGVTNGPEQCDDGNNAGGDGCSATCLAESYQNIGPVKVEGCGNAKLDLGEQCDDGNLLNGDGCDNKCTIEDGRKCTATAPSQCGTRECFEHGERYTQYNISGTCCGGLDVMTFEHVPEKVIGTGVQMAICYDQSVGQPLCLPGKDTSGWYLPKAKGGERAFVVKDFCDGIYQDYYTTIEKDLAEEKSYCQYTDENYEDVSFKDIRGSYEKKAIQAMTDFCIVKGPGKTLKYYRPGHTTTRAEFIKMLIKTLFIGFEYDVQPEGKAYEGDTYFTDVKKTDRFAQYVVKAYELDLIGNITTKDDQGVLTLSPHKRITRDEMMAIVQKIDVGQKMERDMMEKYLGVAKYPDRGEVSALLTRKFIDKFRDYFYFQGRNYDYIEQLGKHIKGKRYTKQYLFIVSQIDKLQEGEHVFDDIITPRDDSDFSVFWAVKYLKTLIYGEDIEK